MKGEVKGKGEYNIYLVNSVFLHTIFSSKTFRIIYNKNQTFRIKRQKQELVHSVSTVPVVHYTLVIQNMVWKLRAKVIFLSFCSHLCNFVHSERPLNPLYFSIMTELSKSSVLVLLNRVV